MSLNFCVSLYCERGFHVHSGEFSDFVVVRDALKLYQRRDTLPFHMKRAGHLISHKKVIGKLHSRTIFASGRIRTQESGEARECILKPMPPQTHH